MVIALLVQLDLSAAFDTIYHNILSNRLENYVGIRGSSLAWFKLYLSDRHQFVAVNEEVSYQSKVQYGVPQGSVNSSSSFRNLGVLFDSNLSFDSHVSSICIFTHPKAIQDVGALFFSSITKILIH